MGQIAAIIKRKTAVANARLRGMSEAGRPLEALAKKLQNIESLSEVVRSLHKKVAARLIPTVRLYVSLNYNLGNGKDDDQEGYAHGDLKKAVENADVVVGLGGIFVRLGKNFSPKTYVIGGALQYGAVRGSRKEKKERTKEKVRREKRALGNDQRSVGGVTVVRAHPFFKITPSQIAQLETKYNQFMQEEITAYLSKAS